MRFLYTCLFYLLTPGLFLRLFWCGTKIPGFRSRWRERLAYYQQPSAQNVLFFHGVSVGEVESIFPLIRYLLREHPELKILVTTTTPSASLRIQTVLGTQVEHVYLPYDLPDANQRFLKHFKPLAAVIVETEIWVNLFAQCAAQQIPLFMINARLSTSSYLGYQKLSALVKPTLACVTLIAAQTETDAQRFKALTAHSEKVQVLGNLKFDSEPLLETAQAMQSLREQLFPQRFVWIIASTHKNEENIFFEIYQLLKQQIPELLLLVVPRNATRFVEVKTLAEKYQLSVVMRTSQQACDLTTDVYLADTMGELKKLYALADVAFVGGSWVDVGGHNILEPAAVGVPVMFGQFMQNFQAIAEGLLQAQAAIQCENSQQLIESLLKLYLEPQERQRLVANATQFIQKNQGVMLKIAEILLAALRKST